MKNELLPMMTIWLFKEFNIIVRKSISTGGGTSTIVSTNTIIVEYSPRTICETRISCLINAVDEKSLLVGYANGIYSFEQSNSA